MAKQSITRSSGLPTGLGPWVVGGGYSGATDELDKTVQKQAELLAKAFGRDVEIRFNSDRRSGGAWLKDDLKGFEGNVQVGFNAEILPVPPRGKERHQWYDELSKKYNWGREMDKEIQSRPKKVYIFTNIKASVAGDPSIVNSGNPDSRYAYTEHKSLKEGVEFLKKYVNRAKVNPYKGEHLAGSGSLQSIHDSRSRLSKSSDERQEHSLVYALESMAPELPAVRKPKPKSTKPKSRKRNTGMTSVRGIRR